MEVDPNHQMNQVQVEEEVEEEEEEDRREEMVLRSKSSFAEGE